MTVDVRDAAIAAQIVADAVRKWRTLSKVDDELLAFMADAIAAYLTQLRRAHEAL